MGLIRFIVSHPDSSRHFGRIPRKPGVFSSALFSGIRGRTRFSCNLPGKITGLSRSAFHDLLQHPRHVPRCLFAENLFRFFLVAEHDIPVFIGDFFNKKRLGVLS